MAQLKNLLNEHYDSPIGAVSPLTTTSPYSWDHVQYSELHKHHKMKADIHRQAAASLDNIPNHINGRKIAPDDSNAIPGVSHKAMSKHHREMAAHHEAAEAALGKIVKGHVDKPALKGGR
jgi:hypothetical protein